MFKVGDKVVLANGYRWFDDSKYKIITGCEKIELLDRKIYYYLDNEWFAYGKEDLKLYKEEEKMEKTFKEVINTIKEGEVWESKFKKISLDENGGIVIKSNGFIDNSMVFSLQNLYRLKREKVDFQTAFKSLEEGKEIESCISEKIYKITNGMLHIYDKNHSIKGGVTEKGDAFSIKEIQGNWYIN